MTKDEAIAAMKEGKKIRYKTWWWDRWITLKDRQLVDEWGRLIKPDNILTEDEGWELFEKQHSQK